MCWPYEVIYTELRWIQVNRRPLRYELRAGAAHEALVETLEWIPRAPVCSPIRARTAPRSGHGYAAKARVAAAAAATALAAVGKAAKKLSP
jgi:hypothetical protein